MIKMATSNRIRVSVIEGYCVSLQVARLPLSVCIQLQECKVNRGNSEYSLKKIALLDTLLTIIELFYA